MVTVSASALRGSLRSSTRAIHTRSAPCGPQATGGVALRPSRVRQTETLERPMKYHRKAGVTSAIGIIFSHARIVFARVNLNFPTSSERSIARKEIGGMASEQYADIQQTPQHELEFNRSATSAGHSDSPAKRFCRYHHLITK